MEHHDYSDFVFFPIALVAMLLFSRPHAPDQAAIRVELIDRIPSYPCIFAPSVIAAAKVFFEPDVKADEKVAAAHFLDFELGCAGAAIAPGDWNHSPGITAHNCF